MNNTVQRSIQRAGPWASESGEPDERFTLRDSREIRHVLTRVLDNGQSITAYIDGGHDFALTSLLAVHAESGDLVLERGPDHAAVKRLLRANRALFVTSHEQVKVKFYLRDFRQIVYEGGAAISAPMPAWVLRLQRREHFRIATPITRPLICAFTVQEDTCQIQAEAVVLDLSIGGVALMENHGTPQFRLGDRFVGCRIGLPEVGTITVDIEVRSVYDTPLKNGRNFRRCGCKFERIDQTAESLIQRYILQLEKRRIVGR